MLTQEQEEAFHAENEQIVQAANEESAPCYGTTRTDGSSSSGRETIL